MPGPGGITRPPPPNRRKRLKTTHDPGTVTIRFPSGTASVADHDALPSTRPAQRREIPVMIASDSIQRKRKAEETFPEELLLDLDLSCPPEPAHLVSELLSALSAEPAATGPEATLDDDLVEAIIAEIDVSF